MKSIVPLMLNIGSLIIILIFFNLAIRAYFMKKKSGKAINKNYFRILKGNKSKGLFVLFGVQGLLYLFSMFMFREDTVITHLGFWFSVIILNLFINITRIGEHGIANGVQFYEWSEFETITINMEFSNSNELYPNGKCLLSLKGSREEIHLFVHKKAEPELKKLLEKCIIS